MTGHRFVSIPSGEDLVPAILAATAGKAAWVSATGHVEGVELRVAGEGTDPVRALRGRLTLVTLGGRAGGLLTATLARATDTGLELVGGVLMRARSAGVELVLLMEQALPEPVSSPARVAASPVPIAQPEAQWSDVTAASPPVALDEGEPYPVANDLVDHFSFGLCEVLMSDGDRLRIRDLRDGSRVREVSLDALKMSPPTISNGKRVFRLLRR